MTMSNDHGLRLGGLDCDRYLSIVIWLPFLLKVTSSIKVRMRSSPRPWMQFNSSGSIGRVKIEIS